jgi:hypothetical protein
MTPYTATRPLIRTRPCESCGCTETVYDLPPYDLCRESPSGDQECERVQAVEELARMASDIALMLTCRVRHLPAASRLELAETIRDAIENAMHDVGGGLDGEVFISICGVKA